MLDLRFIIFALIVLGGCSSNVGLHPFSDNDSAVDHRDFSYRRVAPAWFWEPWSVQR